MRHRHEPWRLTALRLALLAMVTHVLLSAFHGPLQASARTDSLAELLRSVVLCTPQGVRTVTLDDQGQPVPGQDQPSPLKPCPICQALASHVLAAPSLPAVPVHRPIVAAFEWAPVANAPLAEHLLLPRSRGPPASRSA